jgi:hypothetical protein
MGLSEEKSKSVRATPSGIQREWYVYIYNTKIAVVID